MRNGNSLMYIIAKNKLSASISLSTANKNYYLELLSEIKKLGFSVVSTGNTSDKVFSYYSSPRYRNISLSITVSSNETGAEYWVSFVNSSK